MTKHAESLQVADFIAHPVWEFINNDLLGETAVRPVLELPVESLNGRLVGAQVHLANGNEMWALIGNVSVDDPTSTEHFLSISIYRDHQQFFLPRYFDYDYADKGPDALAQFLGLPTNDVFPISYDIKRYVKGDSTALVGKILKEPRQKLTRAELIAMAVA